jgi:hypothetical protein
MNEEQLLELKAEMKLLSKKFDILVGLLEEEGIIRSDDLQEKLN